MIKHISILYRPAGTTKEEFVRYWRDVHAELVKKRLPGLRKYVGDIRIEPRAGERLPGGGRFMECDAIIELHFDDLESLKKAMASDGWLSEERKTSSGKCFDYGRLESVVTEE